MKQMLNFKRRELSRSFSRNVGQRIAQGGVVGSVLATGLAMAQDATDAATKAASDITASGDGVSGVTKAVIGIVVLLAIAAFVRSAIRK